uniref:Uncharacterized protein n=1 Tax=Candidozyma auris TaxID=498019 RepID=A0A0L0P293_CANAR
MALDVVVVSKRVVLIVALGRIARSPSKAPPILAEMEAP